MSHMTESGPWLERYYTLALRPSPRPPTLNACYLQVITPVSPRRQLLVFDGQYTASAILSHAAANFLDADEDNLGVTTENLCGYLIAPVSVLVVPDISRLAPQATLVISALRVFADRWGGNPVGKLTNVDTVPNVLGILRAWVGRKMASFITRDKLERGDHTGELGVGEEVDGDVRGMPTVDVLQLGDLLRDEEERTAQHADTVRMLDRHMHEDSVAEVEAGAGGDCAKVQMVHVGTGEGTDTRAVVTGKESREGEWDMSFRGPALDVDGEVEVDMEETADGGDPLPQTQRFGSEDGDEDDGVNPTKSGSWQKDDDARHTVAKSGQVGHLGNLNAMVDQYWAKEPIVDHPDRSNFPPFNSRKNIQKSLSFDQQNGDDTTVCKRRETAMSAPTGRGATEDASSPRKDRVKHMEANHMGNNMTSEPRDKQPERDVTLQDPAPQPHNPFESHPDKETTADTHKTDLANPTTPTNDSAQVEQPAQVVDSAPAQVAPVDEKKVEDLDEKEPQQSNETAPPHQVDTDSGEKTKDPSAELNAAANGASQDEGTDDAEAPKEAVTVTLETAEDVTTEKQVEETVDEEPMEDTAKDTKVVADKDPHHIPTADPQPVSEQRPDAMEVDTAPPHPSPMEKEPDPPQPAAEARDLTVVEDLAVVDEVQPIIKSGTKRKETDSAVDSEKRKVQRDAVEPAVQAADGPLERLKRELDLMRKFRRAVDKDPEAYVLMPDAFLASLTAKETRRKENGDAFPLPDMVFGQRDGDGVEEGVANVPDSAPI